MTLVFNAPDALSAHCGAGALACLLEEASPLDSVVGWPFQLPAACLGSLAGWSARLGW